MIELLSTAVVILIILLIAEILKRQKVVKAEVARKFVHMGVGIFAATWPFYMSWDMIQWFALSLLLVVYVSRELNLFKAIHGVKRHTWGELLFPVGIGVVAAMEPNKWVFVAAMLHVAIADGLAAVIGAAKGRKNRYKVFGQTKSKAGTIAYWAASITIMTGVVIADSTDFGRLAIPTVLALPPLAALLENISVRGIDNLTVPLFVSITLTTVMAFV